MLISVSMIHQSSYFVPLPGILNIRQFLYQQSCCFLGCSHNLEGALCFEFYEPEVLCNKFMKNYQAAQRSVVMLQQVAKEAEHCKKEALLYLPRKIYLLKRQQLAVQDPVLSFS